MCCLVWCCGLVLVVLHKCEGRHAVVTLCDSCLQHICLAATKLLLCRVWVLAVWPVPLPACTLVAVSAVHLYIVLTVCMLQCMPGVGVTHCGNCEGLLLQAHQQAVLRCGVMTRQAALGRW